MLQECRTVVAGERLVLQGQPVRAVEHLSAVPESSRNAAYWLCLGDAHRLSGDLGAALEAYARVHEVDDDTSAVPGGLAWRLALAHQQRGDPRRALEICGRASLDRISPADEAWLLCATATAHWLLGDAEPALARAHQARDRAEQVDEPRVQAAAHIALALAVSLNGDPATVDELFAKAAALATEAGDLHQLARVDVNRSHHLLADARFDRAVEVARTGGAAAEQLGAATLLAVALGNEAEGLVRLGRYDEALTRLERALALSGRIGTSRTAGALVGLAQVHLRRGCREQARAALEQALRMTDAGGDRQVRGPALACLAITLLPDELDRASQLAARALDEAKGSARLPALLAAGRTAQARGDVESALTFASDAVAHARQRRERAWLAEALELRAGIVRPAQARAALQEALQIWQDSGAGHDADRVLVHLSRLPSSSVSERLSGRLALARLDADDVLQSIRFLPESAPARVRVRTFGRFEVLVDGAVVPAEAWQSRQARELLRLLVCRRGRAVPRLEICELLWPDDDPDRTAHRLSVVLSLLRGVIGQEALEANQACVALGSGGVQVDVEQFLTDVADAVALSGQGSVAAARSLLTEAVGSYVDDPFADAPYDAASEALRDEARAAYLQALRLLAEFCRRAGEDDLAAAYLRRLLESDRYDESAHRGLLSVLVRAGRHGQARLAATRYRAAMADLGLRPAV